MHAWGIMWDSCLIYPKQPFFTSSPKCRDHSPKKHKSIVSRQIWPKFEFVQVLMHVLITCKYVSKGSVENSFPASSKRIGLKTIKKEWRHHFLHHKYMGVFFRCSRADNPSVNGPIWPKFELFLDIIHVLVNYKFKIDWINSK